MPHGQGLCGCCAPPPPPPINCANICQGQQIATRYQLDIENFGDFNICTPYPFDASGTPCGGMACAEVEGSYSLAMLSSGGQICSATTIHRIVATKMYIGASYIGSQQCNDGSRCAGCDDSELTITTQFRASDGTNSAMIRVQIVIGTPSSGGFNVILGGVSNVYTYEKYGLTDCIGGPITIPFVKVEWFTSPFCVPFQGQQGACNGQNATVRLTPNP